LLRKMVVSLADGDEPARTAQLPSTFERWDRALVAEVVLLWRVKDWYLQGGRVRSGVATATGSGPWARLGRLLLGLSLIAMWLGQMGRVQGVENALGRTVAMVSGLVAVAGFMVGQGVLTANAMEAQQRQDEGRRGSNLRDALPLRRAVEIPARLMLLLPSGLVLLAGWALVRSQLYTYVEPAATWVELGGLDWLRTFASPLGLLSLFLSMAALGEVVGSRLSRAGPGARQVVLAAIYTAAWVAQSTLLLRADYAPLNLWRDRLVLFVLNPMTAVLAEGWRWHDAAPGTPLPSLWRGAQWGALVLWPLLLWGVALLSHDYGTKFPSRPRVVGSRPWLARMVNPKARLLGWRPTSDQWLTLHAIHAEWVLALACASGLTIGGLGYAGLYAATNGVEMRGGVAFFPNSVPEMHGVLAVVDGAVAAWPYVLAAIALGMAAGCVRREGTARPLLATLPVAAGTVAANAYPIGLAIFLADMIFRGSVWGLLNSSLYELSVESFFLRLGNWLQWGTLGRELCWGTVTAVAPSIGRGAFSMAIYASFFLMDGLGRLRGEPRRWLMNLGLLGLFSTPDPRVGAVGSCIVAWLSLRAASATSRWVDDPEGEPMPLSWRAWLALQAYGLAQLVGGFLGALSFLLLRIARRADAAMDESLWHALASGAWAQMGAMLMGGFAFLLLAKTELRGRQINWLAPRSGGPSGGRRGDTVSWRHALGLGFSFAIGAAFAFWAERYVARGQQVALPAVEFREPMVFGALVVAAVIVAPLVEEALFRGWFQGQLRAELEGPDGANGDGRLPSLDVKWSTTFGHALLLGIGAFQRWTAERPAMVAWVVTALAFAIVHPMASFAAIFPVGLCLGLLYWRTGALLPGVVMHAAYNLTLLLLQAEYLPRWP
jgi:membrane protease YdiL (CAAX protease family)